MNTFGERIKVTTFGESHGPLIGCVIDGIPSGIYVDTEFIQNEINKRKSNNIYSTKRREDDVCNIVSGVFEGYTTGAPIAITILNKDVKSHHYDNIKDLFRPGHADFTYFHKYKIRDYKGGGRSSARETTARVVAGAFAKLLLNEFHIQIKGGIYSIGNIEAKNINFDNALSSEIFALDMDREEAQKQAIVKAMKNGDSIGGIALISAFGVPKGLGEPLYYKLDAAIGTILGLNGVKAIEIGNGIESSRIYGSQNNDQINKNGFMSNNSGGILGGISNGDSINFKVYFKPTPSIFKPQQTITKQNEEITIKLKGRHDPCIAIRGSVVVQSMLAIILADMLLLNATSHISYLKKIYV